MTDQKRSVDTRLRNKTTLLLALLGAVSTLSAQGREIIVGKHSGATFSEITNAIVAAKPGDKLLVGPGSYLGFHATRGVRILAADGATCGPIKIYNIARGEVFAMRGLDFAVGTSLVPGLEIEDCRGTVLIEDCDSPAFEYSVERTIVERSDDVRFLDCRIRSTVNIDRSRVAIEQCYMKPVFLTGRSVYVCITAKSSKLLVTSSIISGSTHLVFQSGASAIFSEASAIQVHGSSFLAAGGNKDRATQTVNVVMGTGSLRYGPNVVFYPNGSNGKAALGLSTQKLQIPALVTTAAALGGTQALNLQYAKGSFGAVLLGVPRVPVELPLFSGAVAHQHQTVVFATGFPTAEQNFALRIPNDRKLLGLVLSWQAIAGSAARGFVLSNWSTSAISDR